MAKVVLITGANSGLGFELARLILEKGHIVYIGARDEVAGKQAVDALHLEGFKTAKLVIIDITQPSSIKAAAEAIEAAEGKLDVLVNNAGICKLTENQSAVSPSLDVLRAVFDTNFFGTIQTTAVFIPLLRKSTEPSPVILNVTSGLGSNALRAKSAFTEYHITGYNASKAALNSYTITLSHELKKEGFKVNVAAPGYSATKLTGGLGQPVRDGALNLLPWALLDESGPTGKFFGVEGNEGILKEVAW
ncbi:hypothetical protein BJ912DRAFT_82950 [Pholiota molesta]|nr:hypothetical protein BJ912DRAFT_82950 [Pholiota molesta]